MTACAVHRYHSPRPHLTESHHVWPLGMGGPDVAANRVEVCATGHFNIHELLRALCKASGSLPWATLRRFGRAERALARSGYEQWVTAGRPGRPE